MRITAIIMNRLPQIEGFAVIHTIVAAGIHMLPITSYNSSLKVRFESPRIISHPAFLLQNLDHAIFHKENVPGEKRPVNKIINFCPVTISFRYQIRIALLEIIELSFSHHNILYMPGSQLFD